MLSASRRRDAAFRNDTVAKSRRTLGCGQALLPVAVCSLLVAPTAGASAVPVVAGNGGKITLAELAGGGIGFPAEQDAEARSFRFNFPLDASQGPDTWYLIRVDASVSFDRDSKPGSVLLSGFSRGQAGAQVEFYPDRGKDGKPVVRWESVDLIRGQASGVSQGDTARIHYANYLPYAGVRPGPAGLAFQIERFGGATVSAVRVGPASGIYATPAGPVELKVAADVPEEEVLSAGKPARLEVEVGNKSTRVARDVIVSILPQASRMFVTGPATRTIERLQGTAVTHFTVGRTRPGKLRLKAVASAPNGAEALTVIEARVAAPEEGGTDSRPWIALGAIAAFGAAVLIRRRNRRGGAS